MATRVNLTGENALHQGNDETVQVTITPTSASEDLTSVTSLTAIFKPDACTADDHADALTLTSADNTEVEIVAHTADEIVALVKVPASYLTEPYDRVWRVDAVSVSSPGGRTAVYGDVTVVDL